MHTTLLVPLDGSDESEASLPWATSLAQERGLSITLARVTEYPNFGVGSWPEEAMSAETYEQVLVAEQDEAERYLDGVRQRLAETGVPMQTVVRHGSPSVALLDLATELNAEAIMIASHGRSGFKRFVLGSVAMQLVSHTAVPVFLIRATPPEQRREPSLRRLLVPLDGSVLAERALDVAREMAPAGSTMVLVRIVPWPRDFAFEGAAEGVHDAEVTASGVNLAASYLNRVAAPLRAAGLTVETQATVSETQTGISRHLAVAAAAANVDAIVMSTHGRGGVTGWLLGSVADEVVRSVDRPVLLVSARALAARTMGQPSVSDMMTRDVMTLQDDDALLVALRMMVRRRTGGAPVLDATGRLVGVISQRDVMAWHERTRDLLAKEATPGPDEYLRRLRTEPVRSVMSAPPVWVRESATLDAALALMREHGVHRLPVMRDDRVVGILTGSDIQLAMLAQIETSHETHRHEDLQPAPELLASVVGAD